jgi:hypothetical protein
MSKVDTGPLRQLYDHLGIEPLFVMPSLAAWQLQEQKPQQELPSTLLASVDRLRDLAVTSRNFLQIGAFEFTVGLDFLHGGRTEEAIPYFEAARRQWLFIDHLPLISLAHLAEGLAYHAAKEHGQAAASYFKVKQCLHEAEAEPYRLEKIEAERSLQAFWNDLERWLILAIGSLRRDFDRNQGELLRSELADVAGEESDEPDSMGREKRGAVSLSLRMNPCRAISAGDVDTLIYQTVDGIEVLNEALMPVQAGKRNPQPTVAGIHYSDQGNITIEVSNVASHTVAFCRWLMTTIPVENQPAADSVSKAPAEEMDNNGNSRSWFRWQVQSGQVAELMRSYVKSVTGRELQEDDLEHLMQIIGHLAELRANCQLTVM